MSAYERKFQMSLSASEPLPGLRNRWLTVALAVLSIVAMVAFGGDPVRAQSPADDAASPAEPQPPKRVVIRFLTEGDFPPFNYLDDDGVLSGFNVDLARALCAEAGAACDIKVRPWDELLIALRRGDADAVIAAHNVSARLLGEVEFTDRYFYTPGRFVALNEVPDIEINPETLDGKSIAVARGSAHEAFIKAFFRQSRVQPYETSELAREALQQGRVDFVFDDGISLAFWLNGTLSRRCCGFRGGPFLEPKYFGDGLAIAVPRNDPQIRLILNEALQRLRANGRFEELVARYFPHRVL
ncbi:MAG: transporter substrate-binding domain-containing protein [Hyphomicrobium sp.]|nr:transporter substrate-binding domain-containing protein [Hyphomicrobium sp.]